jgi:hypothetical protein
MKTANGAPAAGGSRLPRRSNPGFRATEHWRRLRGNGHDRRGCIDGDTGPQRGSQQRHRHGHDSSQPEKALISPARRKRSTKAPSPPRPGSRLAAGPRPRQRFDAPGWNLLVAWRQRRVMGLHAGRRQRDRDGPLRQRQCPDLLRRRDRRVAGRLFQPWSWARHPGADQFCARTRFGWASVVAACCVATASPNGIRPGLSPSAQRRVCCPDRRLAALRPPGERSRVKTICRSRRVSGELVAGAGFEPAAFRL